MTTGRINQVTAFPRKDQNPPHTHTRWVWGRDRTDLVPTACAVEWIDLGFLSEGETHNSPEE